MERVLSKRLLLVAGLVAVMLMCAVPAQAAFPGGNERIAFHNAEGIWRIDSNGANPIKLADAGVSVAWSHDDDLAFAEGNRVVRINSLGHLWGKFDPGFGQQTVADPTWAPDGTKIAFVYSYEDPDSEPPADEFWGIGTMDRDGTDPAPGYLTQGAIGQLQIASPTWSPNGTRIVFAQRSGSNWDIYSMQPDGSGPVNLTNTPDVDEHEPNFSPDTFKLVFAQGEGASSEVYVMDADGTDRVPLTTNTTEDTSPAWAPDQTKITFQSDAGGVPAIHTMNADGTGIAAITAPQSPGGDFAPDWNMTEIGAGYPRPRGANPLRVSLVPAYEVCNAPNRQHGPALAHPSCSPPRPLSPRLTIGVGDGSPAFSRSIGWVRLAVISLPAPPDNSDVKLGASITNVMNAADLSEYAGELRARMSLRITDKDNPPGHNGGPGTVSDALFGFTIPCSPTAATLDASTCAINTTANAVLPGVVKEDRAIWQLGQVQVFDGGADGDGDTEGDNELFEVQGIFVP